MLLCYHCSSHSTISLFLSVLHRPVLHPEDLSSFDKLLSPHEYAAISKKNRSLDNIDWQGRVRRDCTGSCVM